MTKKYFTERVIHNKAQCLICKDIIESTHRHDFKWCKCNTLAVDGGHDYTRRCFSKGTETWLELSTFEQIEREKYDWEKDDE